MDFEELSKYIGLKILILMSSYNAVLMLFVFGEIIVHNEILWFNMDVKDNVHTWGTTKKNLKCV